MFLPRKLSAPKPWVWDKEIDVLAIPERGAYPATEEGAAEFQAAQDKYDAAWAEFRKTGNVAAVPVKPGCVATVFHLASLTIDQIRHIDGLPVGANITETIAYGCHNIENLSRPLAATGDAMEIVKVVRVASQCGYRLPDEILELFQDDRLRLAVYLEIKRAGRVTKEAAKSDRG